MDISTTVQNWHAAITAFQSSLKENNTRNTRVSQHLHRAALMNPFQLRKWEHIAVTHWQHTTEMKANAHPVFWLRKENYNLAMQLWKWRQPPSWSFAFLPFLHRSLYSRDHHYRAQHKNSTCQPSTPSEPPGCIRALTGEQRDAAHQKIHDE